MQNNQQPPRQPPRPGQPLGTGGYPAQPQNQNFPNQPGGGQFPVGTNPNLGQPPFAPQGQMPPNMKADPKRLNQRPSNNKRGKSGGDSGKKNKKFKILGIFTVIGLIVGVMAFVFVNRYAKVTTIIDLGGVAIKENSGDIKKKSKDSSEDTTLNPLDSNLNMADLAIEKGEPWDGSTRITCLAMGLDYRDWEAGEKYARTDSMMLLTYDPVTGYAGMLSIPRDLWVAIPGTGEYGTINTAYFIGESWQLPGGGPELAKKTVEMLLGIDIQYYAIISFEGFIDFIDSIDKLAINVKEPITVDPIGPANTVTLMAGVQDLDGATALAYARERHTNSDTGLSDDFARAQRQQDVIFALYEQMVWQLPKLLSKADQLYADLSKALITNIGFTEMMKLAWTIVDIKEYQIIRSVIAPPYQVDLGKNDKGKSILIPIPDKIREARDVIFSHGAATAPVAVSGDRVELIRAESANVTLLNGTSVAGVFERTIPYLQSFGLNIINQGPGSASYVNSLQILDGKPYTAKFLTDLMSIPSASVTINYDPGNASDLILTITDAWANSNPMGGG